MTSILAEKFSTAKGAKQNMIFGTKHVRCVFSTAVRTLLKVRKVFNLKQDEEDEDEEDVPVYKMNMGDQPEDKEYFVELKHYQAVNEQLKVRKVFHLQQDEEDEDEEEI